MKAVMMSIQPKWCELIASGKKTVEVRKTKPKLETPFKVYIYCTKPKKFFKISSVMYSSKEYLHLCDGKVSMGDGFDLYNKEYKTLNGKVIGEFVCDEIEILRRNTIFNAPALYSQSCLTREEYFDYIGDKTTYIWHISDLVIYDEPKELSEFYNSCGIPKNDIGVTKKCWKCDYYEVINGSVGCTCYTEKPITRPPQSWCYVEELR